MVMCLPFTLMAVMAGFGPALQPIENSHAKWDTIFK
jgi:hypothetical protein